MWSTYEVEIRTPDGDIRRRTITARTPERAQRMADALGEVLLIHLLPDEQMPGSAPLPQMDWDEFREKLLAQGITPLEKSS